jgi:hypothetical protein
VFWCWFDAYDFSPETFSAFADKSPDAMKYGSTSMNPRHRRRGTRVSSLRNVNELSPDRRVVEILGLRIVRLGVHERVAIALG